MGFPQGGVCSAKFWIIAFDEAAKILNSNGVNGELFADDGNGIIGGTDTEYMAQSLQGPFSVGQKMRSNLQCK